jgi:hypothetical protein
MVPRAELWLSHAVQRFECDEVSMGLDHMSTAFPSLGREYEEFLYAVICREKNGMQLTVASAIARSGVDPWDEAVRISKMAEGAALQALIGLIPNEASSEANSATGRQTIASHLFSLLPKRRLVVETGKLIPIRVKTRAVVFCMLLFFAGTTFGYLLRMELSPSTQNPANVLGQAPS